MRIKDIHVYMAVGVMLLTAGSVGGVHIYKAEAFMNKTSKRFAFEDLTTWEKRLIHLEQIYGDFVSMPEPIQTEYIWIKGEICKIKLSVGIVTECH